MPVPSASLQMERNKDRQLLYRAKQPRDEAPKFIQKYKELLPFYL